MRLKIKNIEKCIDEALLKDMSVGDVRKILNDSLNEKITASADYMYIEDLWEDRLVYSTDTGSFRIAFVIDENGEVIWGIPTEVVRKVTYEPKEAKKLESKGIILKEGRKGNLFPIKIIAPGWGSSGYYPKEVLERDKDVFKAGLQMFWDHPTLSEEEERPERSLRDLAGVLATDAEWKEGGKQGAGLYSTMKAFEPYVSAVKELAPHIGVSIRAYGTATEGEIDGESGLIIEEITDAASVDIVTMPGAGGKVLELFESYRKTEVKENTMAELKELQEANKTLTKENEELTDASDTAQAELAIANEKIEAQEKEVIENEATAYVEKALADSDLPEAAQKKMVSGLVDACETIEGKLDEAKLAAAIEKAVADELAYIESIMPEGGIRGMGDITEKPKGKMKESWIDFYVARGMTLEEATKMAELGE